MSLKVPTDGTAVPSPGDAGSEPVVVVFVVDDGFVVVFVVVVVLERVL
jgi:hypothetical protein